MGWLKKTLKKVTKGVKKVGSLIGKAHNTALDALSGGQFSKLTNSSSWLEKYRKETMLADLAIVGGAGLAGAFGAGGASAVGSNAWLPSSASQAANLGVPYTGGLASGATSALAGAGTSGFLTNLLGGVGSQFLGGLVNTGLGLVTNKLTAEDTLKRNLALQQDAFNKNVEMWNMQNAYNTPLQQMARYQQAGLNPNLIYGNGVSSAGNASGAPQYEAPTYKGMDMSSIMAFQQLQNAAQQNELLAQQTELAKIQAIAAAMNAEYIPETKEVEIAIKRATEGNIIANTNNTKINSRRNKVYTDLAEGGRDMLSPERIAEWSLWDKIGDWMYRHSKAHHDMDYNRRALLRRMYGDNWRKYY